MPSSKDPSSLVNPTDGNQSPGAASPGGAVSLLYGPGPNWADGTTNPPTTIPGEINKIIIDLSSLTGGTAKIGGPSIVGVTLPIPAGTLRSQLVLLKDANYIDFGGSPAWLDGSLNPQTSVQGQLSKIIVDLTNTGNTSPGTQKIGTGDLIGTTDTISGGFLYAQLLALKQSNHTEYAAGPSWAGGTSPTNPATNVQAQIDKIINDLAAETSGASGADRLGTAALVGASSTIVAGTVFAALGALKSAANLDKTVGPTWANADTNPAALLSTFIDNIITALAATTGNGGTARVGGIAVPTTTGGNSIPAGTLNSQLVSLKHVANLDAPAVSPATPGISLSAGTVEAQLSTLATNAVGKTPLASQSIPTGESLIGGQALTGASFDLPAGTLNHRLQTIIDSAAPSIDVQEFFYTGSSQTWTAPTWVVSTSIVEVELIGGGGGGHGGQSNSPNGVGGGGGGGGGRTKRSATYAEWGGSTLTVNIGAAGTGGPGGATTGGTGSPGTDGGDTTVGNIKAGGGGGAPGVTPGVGGTGDFLGGTGGSGGTAGNPGSAAADSRGGAAGGGGGGSQDAGTGYPGGDGGVDGGSSSTAAPGGPAGNSPSGNGTAGSPGDPRGPGGGGGGGGGSPTGSGFAGSGAGGGNYGGGGGGGGGAQSTSGHGGAGSGGAPGFARITTRR